MIKRLHKFILSAALLLAMLAFVCPEAVAASPKWEFVSASSPSAHPALAEAMEADRFEVYTRDNFIFIFSPRPTTVKVFSILGQLICEANVQPGVSRLRIPSRGIYILKTDSLTRRVTI